MTAPRQVLPGVTYLVTHRCTQRRYLLRPSKVTNEVFEYLLAVAADRFGVAVHAYCVMSNHYHLVVTDSRARLPAFQQFLDALVARAVNALLGRWEHFWAPGSYSAVTLGTPEAIVDKAAYVLANPVAARLVRLGRKWPGLWSSPGAFGSSRMVQRPKHFFSENGSLPERAELRLTVPPGFNDVSNYRRALEAAVSHREAEASRRGAGFLGVKRVLSQRPSSMPVTEDPRRALRPRVAARDKWKRIELLGRLKGFLEDYREALEVWRERRGAAVFPAGTYLMRIAHGARCAGFG